MKKQANILMVEHIVTTFQKKGCDVHIKNGDGNFVIAVLGSGIDEFDLSIARPFAGVDRMERDNDFFNSNHQEFVEAWEFFRRREE